MEKQEKDFVVYTIKYQGKVKYVGSTDNFERRKAQHLSKGRNHSAIPSEIDASMVTIGIVRHWKSEKAMLNSEDRLIRKYDTINNGWNKNRSSLGLSTENMTEYHRLYLKSFRNREKFNEYMRNYMRTYNKEKQKEYSRRWYEKHKKIKIAD